MRGWLPWRPIGSRGAILWERWASRPVRPLAGGDGRSGRGAVANDKIRLGPDRRGEPGQPAPRDVPAERRGRRRRGGRRRRSARLARPPTRSRRQKGKRPKTMRDYREMLDDKDIDAVVIATPDHWHALPAIHAVMAGKDVYVEKPVGHNVAEGQAMIKAARKYDKVDGRRHPAAARRELPEGRRGRPLGQDRQGLLGPDLELREHQPGRHGHATPTPRRPQRRLRPLARPRPRAAVQPEPVPPPLPLVLRLRRRHDERLGRPPERHRPLGPRRQGPAGGVRHRRHLHHRRRPRHARHAPGRLRVPRLHADLLDAQGQRPEVQRARATASSSAAPTAACCSTARATRSSPTRSTVPYGIKLVHGDRPVRKIELEGREGQGRRRPAGAHHNFLECL